MKKSIFLIFNILVLNISCKRETNIKQDKTSNVILDQNFLSKQNLKSITLENISDSLLFTTLPYIKDDYLFISEKKSDHLLHSISIPNDNYLGKYLNSGSGPGEGLIAWTLYENQGLLGVYDDKQKKLIEFEVDSSNNEMKFKNEYRLPSSIISGRAYHFDNQIYYLSHYDNQIYAMQSTDLKGQNIKGYGQLPTVDKKEFNVERDKNLVNVYNAILDHNKGTFVIGYQFMPILKIFNSKNNKWITINGPDDYVPTLETIYKQIFYSYVKITDKYIYALYDGRDNVKEGPERQNSNLIYIFDHQGKPVKKLILDKGIFSFAIYKDSYLYGLRLNEIGEFKLIKAKI